ncbi:hypothetical protein ACWDV4_15175 [Micromonospora sp. NPDC003197]
MPDRRRPGPVVVASAATALLLAVAFLLAPPMGTDLSAQVARADFYARHGYAVLDFGWYGGVSPYGYSLITPPLMSWLGDGHLGPRVAGAIALLVSAWALALLLLRTAARRPMLAGVIGAVCVAGNLVSGRITYAIGVAFGLLALLALTLGRRWLRLLAATVAALLASAASPVAGLFVGLAGVALVLGALPVGALRRRPDRSRLVDGAVLAVAAAVPMAVMSLPFGAGGWMNISLLDAVRAIGASLVVALLVPRRPVRFGALLSALGVAVAFVVPTPVGLNATRLAAMFALPVLAGYAVVPAALSARIKSRMGRVAATARAAGAAALAALLVLVAIGQPPVSVGDLRNADDPAASRAYFQPLLDELARRQPARVEVVPTGNYWEAAYVPETAPLARGWLRQADQAYHRLFFDGSIDAASYRDWLLDNGVAYVALAEAKPSWVGRREAELIRGGLPYLTPVWRNADWTLYAVSEASSIVSGATSIVSGATSTGASLVELTPTRLIVDVPRAGEVLVRLRWSRWLSLDGPAGCLAPQGDWIVLRADQPGRYTISGSLTGAGPHCTGPRAR